MKYPFYSVTSKFFNGIYFSPYNEGIFYDIEEAKACYDSVELDDRHFDVSLSVFYEDRCETLCFKEQEIKLPTPETMGRAKYIPLKECKRLLKEGKL